MNENELKLEYNKLLKRFWNAECYMDDNVRTPGEREKWVPHFLKIMKDLSNILNRLKDMGVNYTEDESINGFKVEKVAKL